ncbi:MAG: PH domain-containing protein [Geodermatophilaceae bacterium]|nr:PH domain-containing protein [Geodermatophilaceae bacterium]
MNQPAQLQMNRIALVPAVVAVVCALPLATASPWLLFILLLPAASITYVLRSGVEVDDDGLIVRAMFGSARIPWGRITGVLIGKRHELSITTVNGGAVRLPNMRVRDLPRLYEATDGRLGLSAEDAG